MHTPERTAPLHARRGAVAFEPCQKFELGVRHSM